MPKFLALTFCSTFVLCSAFPGVTVAQSAVPITQAPVLPKATLAESVKQTIANKTTETQMVRQQLEVLKLMREKVHQRLQEVESEAFESGVSVESFPEIVKILQAKRIELMIDVAGLDAKRKAILSENQKQPDDSAIVIPLEKIVAHSQDTLARLQRAKASSAELRTAEMALLMSKVKLAEAKGRKPSSTLLSDSLLNTSLTLAESKARLARTESLLNEVLPTRKQLESTKLLKEQTNRLAQDESELSKQLRTAERFIERLKFELEHSETSKDLP